MIQYNPNLYSPEYVESIRERFPELAWSSEKELVEALDNNDIRKPWVYEFELQDALEELDDEVSISGKIDVLKACPPHYLKKLLSAIEYVIINLGWNADIVLNVTETERTSGRESTIWVPAFQSDFSFLVQSKDKEYLAPSENKKILFVISIKNAHKNDSLWRPVYSLTPKKIEIPSKNSLLMNGMYFKQEIVNFADLQTEFQNLS